MVDGQGQQEPGADYSFQSGRIMSILPSVLIDGLLEKV